MSSVIYEYTLDQAVADGQLVEVFKDRWTELTSGKALIASRHVIAEFSMAALQEIWNEYVQWKDSVEQTLPEEERLFSTAMNGRKVWVLEDDQSFTILFPEDY